MPAKFPTSSLATVLAVTLQTIEVEGKYVAPNPKDKKVQATAIKVLEHLQANPTPTLADKHVELAQEIIAYFKTCTRSDDAHIVACKNIAIENAVKPLTFFIAVSMPITYSKLNPKKVDPNAPKPEPPAEQLDSYEYMGEINKRDRFFVKLVSVRKESTGQYLFQVVNPDGAKGFWYDTLDRTIGMVFIGDCFAMNATVQRQQRDSAGTGEYHTIFRQVDIVDSYGPGITRPKIATDTPSEFVPSATNKRKLPILKDDA